MIKHEELKEKFDKGIQNVREDILEKCEDLHEDLNAAKDDIEEGVADLKEHLSERWPAKEEEQVEEVDPALHKTSEQYAEETDSYDGTDYTEE